MKSVLRKKVVSDGVWCCDIYAHYACVADCADAMADAWEDTAGCAHADCLHGNILIYSKVIVHRYVGIA